MAGLTETKRLMDEARGNKTLPPDITYRCNPEAGRYDLIRSDSRAEYLDDLHKSNPNSPSLDEYNEYYKMHPTVWAGNPSIAPVQQHVTAVRQSKHVRFSSDTKNYDGGARLRRRKSPRYPPGLTPPASLVPPQGAYELESTPADPHRRQIPTVGPPTSGPYALPIRNPVSTYHEYTGTYRSTTHYPADVSVQSAPTLVYPHPMPHPGLPICVGCYQCPHYAWG